MVASSVNGPSAVKGIVLTVGHGKREVEANARAVAALQAVCEYYGEGLILTDASGRIVTISRLAELTLGWSAGCLIGQQCRRFLRCFDANDLDEYHPSCQDCNLLSNGRSVQRLVRVANGGRLGVNARSSHILGEDGEALGILCTFSEAPRRDGLLDRASAEFLSNVTHELRTPLSSLAASVELLADSYRLLPRRRVERMLQVTHHSMVQLQNLVENLLSASSIQLGNFHIQPKPSDLAEIIDDAISFVEPILDKKQQQIRMQMRDGLPLVVADPRRITQVIVNLLSNAHKYGPPGDEIELSVIQRSCFVKISISEHGPGIAPAEQRTIFERFYRSRPAEPEAPQGVGLGLALVKSIISSHGGRVGVQSQIGAGSTFWFTLPTVIADKRSMSRRKRGET